MPSHGVLAMDFDGSQQFEISSKVFLGNNPSSVTYNFHLANLSSIK
jgi:hypothetical protein